jgi:hypothetical protein
MGREKNVGAVLVIEIMNRDFYLSGIIRKK